MTFFKKKEEKGFTIGESLLLLIVISILISLFVPFFIRAKEKATQKSTMVDMQMWAEAIACYIADYSVAPPNPNGLINYKKALVKEVLPYAKAIRIVDWWGDPYLIWTGKGIEQYGIKTGNEKEFIIASLGKEGIKENWKYDSKNPQSGFFEVREFEDFEKDLVFWNNKFIRCPREKN